MDRAELKTLTEQLLGGRTLNDTLFTQLLNMAKNKREMMRPWMILREQDTSVTVEPSDIFTDTQSLPTGFLRTFSLRPVSLFSSDGVKEILSSKFSDRYINKDKSSFYIDVKNNAIGFTGTRNRTYTAVINMIKASDDFTDGGS